MDSFNMNIPKIISFKTSIYSWVHLLLLLCITAWLPTDHSFQRVLMQNSQSEAMRLIEKSIKRPLLPVINPKLLADDSSFRPFASSPRLGVFKSEKLLVHSNLRVLQFNVLADGLSGMRSDLGGFSRARKSDILWSNRRHKLINEITQYDPDIITLQECDHYNDFFHPKLWERGYDGLFSPKPASACLEVSPYPDGCCLFVKRSKLKIRTYEIMTYALSKADIGIDKKSINEDDFITKALNQVAIIAVCDLVSSASETPPVIVATTHLKALKTHLGEKYRAGEMKQLLNKVNRVAQTLQKETQLNPAVIITGDLNATPTNSTTGYPSETYSVIKENDLALRSVLNDDVPINHAGVLGNAYKKGLAASEIPSDIISNSVWTTWKARIKQGKEAVVKRCLDYILYSPIAHNREHYVRRRVGVRAASVLDLFDDQDVKSNYFPSATYPSDHIAVAADLQIVQEI